MTTPTRPAAAMTRRLAGFWRAIWRQLTSMRIALILLFLLALGSLPAALLPQWYLNASKTASYIDDHPVVGPLLDKLGFFDTIASPWYSAIYLLLAISLIGCITPRSIELVRQWRAKPGRAPRNLARMPHHATVTVADDPRAAAERIRHALRHKGLGGWRTTVREEQRRDGTTAIAISAERGYMREIGNLVFHVAVLGLLFTMAIGSMFGFTGSILVTQGKGFCSSAPVSYDNFRPGRMVDGTGMTPFCVHVDEFQSAYDPRGRALYYRAKVGIQTGDELGGEHFDTQMLNINHPIRLSGQRLYLLGHGYVPQFHVTFPDGQQRDYEAPFQPQDNMFTSDGVVKIPDPPGYSGDAVEANQLAIVGVFAPTAVKAGEVLESTYPTMLSPEVSIEVYRGNLGLDHGSPQSVFAIDTAQVTNGELVSQADADLGVDESMTLADGTVITFTGATEYVSLQTSYDPVQGWALVFAILLVAGILTSLTIKRRRVWYRITPAGDDAPTLDGGATVDIGGLARTDQAGYGGEFDSLVALPGPGVTATGVAATDTSATAAALDDGAPPAETAVTKEAKQ